MIILGLDPGLARTGFGVLDTNKKNLFVRCGCITTPATQTIADRLSILGQDLAALIAATKPDRAIVEEIFFGNNKKTAMITAQARGVALYILREHHISIRSITPLQIKSRLCGFGQATKQQVQKMVVARLGLTTTPQPDDAADGLAAALCAIEQNQLQKVTIQ